MPGLKFWERFTRKKNPPVTTGVVEMTEPVVDVPSAVVAVAPSVPTAAGVPLEPTSQTPAADTAGVARRKQTKRSSSSVAQVPEELSDQVATPIGSEVERVITSVSLHALPKNEALPASKPATSDQQDRQGNSPGAGTSRNGQSNNIAGRSTRRQAKAALADGEEAPLLAPLPGKPVKNSEALNLDVPLVIAWYSPDGEVLVRPGVFACVERIAYESKEKDKYYFYLIRWEDRPLVAKNPAHPVVKIVLDDVTLLRIVESPPEVAVEVSVK